jgi:hypothetical protein
MPSPGARLERPQRVGTVRSRALTRTVHDHVTLAQPPLRAPNHALGGFGMDRHACSRSSAGATLSGDHWQSL